MNLNTSSHANQTACNEDATRADIYGPFPAGVHWSAQDLADAVRLPQALHTMPFTPSANDALLHRPRQGASFLPAPSRTHHFRVGG